MENVARLLSSDFADAQQILSGGTDGRDGLIAEFRTQLARVPIEETAIDQVLKLIESDIGSDFGMSDLLREAGVALLRQSRFTSAETYLRRSISLSEEQLGSEHPNTATTLFHLAELLQATNRLSEAESLYLKALEVNERILGPSHPSVISTYANLASLYKVTERFAEAEMMYQQVLHMLEMTEGRSGNIANVYNNLASLYKQTQRFKEAEVMYQQALRMLEMTGQSGDLANAYNNLASLYKETQRFNEAEAMYEKALYILKKTASGRPAQARSLNGLGEVLIAKGKIQEAESALRRALTIFESTYNRNHPEAVKAKENLARILESKGENDEARSLRDQVEFDTFISYNSTDRRIVHQLARELEARRVRVWLDDNELLPGMSLVDAMSQVLYISRSAVVCIGSSEQNPWQSEELKALLLQSIDEGRPVIPVLLPGAKPHPQLPRFLMSVACLDLRDGMSKEGLDKLTEAITGRKPRLL